jgi:hypothetical protein
MPDKRLALATPVATVTQAAPAIRGTTAILGLDTQHAQAAHPAATRAMALAPVLLVVLEHILLFMQPDAETVQLVSCCLGWIQLQFKNPA